MWPPSSTSTSIAPRRSPPTPKDARPTATSPKRWPHPTPPAVLLASPGVAHEAALLTAFEHDLPVLCEKPLTPDAASALRVLEAEQRLGDRRVQVGFMRPYDHEYIKLKALLDSGELGRPLMLHNRHRNPSCPPDFTSAMLINDSVTHEMDITRWLLSQDRKSG